MVSISLDKHSSLMIAFVYLEKEVVRMAPKNQEAVNVSQIQMVTRAVKLIGRTPLFCNRMSAKAKQQLLIGAKRKTAAERTLIKHDPIAEFRESMLIEPTMDMNSVVMFPAVAFKGAMATAALVVPGITKTSVQRLIYIEQEYVPIYGVPKLRMDVVRSADMNKTPDIRTRAFFPQWGTELTLSYASDTFGQTSILSLLPQRRNRLRCG